MKLNGSRIIIECLKEQGVDTVFGYPGGTILNVYDALYDETGINHILTSHEQGAAHAADGYARATGKVGVCFATSGPGATNLVTGIATANMDSVPIVAITVNVINPLLGKDTFQEVDIAGVVMPVTKHSMIVKDIAHLADTIRRAFKIASSGRKGPVLVDITKDVTAAEYEYTYKKPEEIKKAEISAEELENAANMINASKKPYLFVGGGCVAADASKELKEFQNKLQAPVCDTLMGKGAFSGTDPMYLGMLGMHGTKSSNLCIYKCDLLIVLGARFSDRCVGDVNRFAGQAKILQIDVDEVEFNKNVLIDASVVGDVKEVLKKLTPMIEKHENPEWTDCFMGMKEKYPLNYDHNIFCGPSIIEEIYKQTGGDAVMSTDVGQHQMWTAMYYKFAGPRKLLTSGGSGTMGYGLGASIGAKVALPEKTVVNVTGDGCFRMNMNELATASRYNIPVIEVLFNNHTLGMVRQWQNLFYKGRYSQTTLEDKVDYVKVAEGLGVKGVRVTTNEEFKEAFAKALKAGEPYLIECLIGQDDKVFPMIPSGKPNKAVFDESDL